MDEIAYDLALSKATLYLYFKNKQSLYFAVALRGMIILHARFKKVQKNETIGIKQVLGIAQTTCDYIESHSEYDRLNIFARGGRFTTMIENKKIENFEVYIGIVMELLNILKEAIILGIKDGSIRKNLDPNLTTIYLSRTIETVIRVTPEYQFLLQQAGLTKEKYIQQSIDMLLHGITEELT